MKAHIRKLEKTATQSGRGLEGRWVLEYEVEAPRRPEALMGWTGAGDTLNQVCLRFENLEDAVRFARARGLDYSVSVAHDRKIKPRNYSDNFVYVSADEGQ